VKRVCGTEKNGQILQCELQTECGNILHCGLMTDRGQRLICEVLTCSRPIVQCDLMIERTESKLYGT